MIKTDRSRIIQFQRSPRTRWKGYHEGPHKMGWVKNTPKPALQYGSLAHDGLDRLILGNPIDQVVADLDSAARIMDWGSQLRHDEARSLLEAHLRVAAITAIPALLEEYAVEDTEREEELQLSPGILLMARTDAVLRHRETGDYYVGSWKTKASYDRRAVQSHLHDSQGISEPLAVEARIGKPVMGVQLMILIKGRPKRMDDPGEQGILQNSLVYGWTNGREWAHSYNWSCKDSHDKCMGWAKHRLGKGWEQVPVATCFPDGVRGWINSILTGEIQPLSNENEGFFNQWVTLPPPILRPRWERERWVKQVEFQESTIGHDVEMCHEHPECLNECFPQYEHSCNYPGECEFVECCWRQQDVENMEEMGFVPREPNHPNELTVEGE
jgi:hypothetical protein